MQSEIESIKRLKNPRQKVSCHYLINRKGEVIQMVKDKNIAWHAGKSRWKEFKNLNITQNQDFLGSKILDKGGISISREMGYDLDLVIVHL